MSEKQPYAELIFLALVGGSLLYLAGDAYFTRDDIFGNEFVLNNPDGTFRPATNMEIDLSAAVLGGIGGFIFAISVIGGILAARKKLGL